MMVLKFDFELEWACGVLSASLLNWLSASASLNTKPVCELVLLRNTAGHRHGRNECGEKVDQFGKLEHCRSPVKSQPLQFSNRRMFSGGVSRPDAHRSLFSFAARNALHRLRVLEMKRVIGGIRMGIAARPAIRLQAGLKIESQMRTGPHGIFLRVFTRLSESNISLNVASISIGYRHDINFGNVVGRARRGSTLGASH